MANWSLIDGWLPVAAQMGVLALLVCASGWRDRRWRVRSLPLAVGLGVVLTFSVKWAADQYGVVTGSAPLAVWWWVAISGLAIAVVVLGWVGTRWWRRILSVLAVPLCVSCCALVLNGWIGYFPTVRSAWVHMTSGPLPDEIDPSALTTLQRSGGAMAAGGPVGHGVVVPVSIDDRASHFRHRDEMVYLPPAWFAHSPPDPLPVLMMIGAEMNTPADWLRAGRAANTMDDFAAHHGGHAPVLVFVDSGGAFAVDTECVNGPRGNAADHLTKDVIPFMIAKFGVSADRKQWGVVGFSSGGTCAIELAVMHPELFTAFEDIAGDRSPNSGNRDQTLARLFGGDAELAAMFDPTSAMMRHGPYEGVSGWFAVPGTPGIDGISRDARGNPEGQDIVAASLCETAATHGIRCAVEAQPGLHDWPFAADAFASALPWLAGEVGTPGVPRSPLRPFPGLPGAKPETGPRP